EGRRPASHVAVAALGIEEGPLVEGLDRLAALLFEGNRDKCLDARGRAVIVPGERENEPLVLDNLAIDAPEPVLAVGRRRDHCAVGTADAEVDLCLGAGEIRRAHPALHVFRLGPERKTRKSIFASGQGKFAGTIQRFMCSGLDQSAKSSEAGASMLRMMRSSSSPRLVLN